MVSSLSRSLRRLPFVRAGNADASSPWGEKAFAGYLGENREEWKKHDATELMKSCSGNVHCLVDVGTGDNFYKQGQLLPENLVEAAKTAKLGATVEIRMQDEYDHSYPSIIASFAEDHVNFHAKFF